MNLSTFFPPEAVAWLLRYGVFSALLFFAAIVVALLLRPFWLWFTGKAELLERVRRLEDSQRKALFELEMLNQTLSIPLKKSAAKTKAADKPEEPLVVSDATKADFLKALEKSRARINLPDSDD